MEPYRMSLPLPPLLGEYYMNARRIVKHGPRAGQKYTGKMISPVGQAFRMEVITESRRGHRTPPNLTGPLTIFVMMCKGTHTKSGAKAVLRKSDLDNRWKCLLDALTNAKIIGDDVLFDDQRMIRGAPVPGGRCYLAITRFDPDAALKAAAAVGLPFRQSYCDPQDDIPF